MLRDFHSHHVLAGNPSEAEIFTGTLTLHHWELPLDYSFHQHQGTAHELSLIPSAQAQDKQLLCLQYKLIWNLDIALNRSELDYMSFSISGLARNRECVVFDLHNGAGHHSCSIESGIHHISPIPIYDF